MRESPFLAYNRNFAPFDQQHLAVLGLALFLCLSLPWIGKKWLSATQQTWLARGLAASISLAAVSYIVIRLWLGDFDPRTDLPLDICNLTGLLLPFLVWNPSYRIHEVLYFWILVGTVQANLTPHLYNGFPNFIFIKYWMVHAGLVVYIVYAIVAFDYRPDRHSAWRAYLFLQPYLLIVLIINWLLGSNYVYLLGKPPTASVLDLFGPWPWYVLIVDLLLLPVFYLARIPVRWLEDGRRRQGDDWHGQGL